MLRSGYDYLAIGELLDIPAGQAYLVATGIPADGSGVVDRQRHDSPGFLITGAQRLVNPRTVNPTGSSRVRDWLRDQANRAQH